MKQVSKLPLQLPLLLVRQSSHSAGLSKVASRSPSRALRPASVVRRHREVSRVLRVGKRVGRMDTVPLPWVRLP
jgi:hypothetical protein